VSQLGRTFRLSLLALSLAAVFVVVMGWTMQANDERRQKEMGKPDRGALRPWRAAASGYTTALMPASRLTAWSARMSALDPPESCRNMRRRKGPGASLISCLHARQNAPKWCDPARP
jgi:hypothetical protein